ncbi:MAG: hypothetical protein WA842_09385 [Croceibacterium sp.]
MAKLTEGFPMVIRKALLGLATAGLVFGSTAVAAAPVARTGAPVGQSENLGGSFGWILALLIAAGVIGVIASDSDEPVSP